MTATLTVVLAQTFTTETLLEAVVRIIGFSALAAIAAAVAALVFHWYSGTSIPDGVAILLGISPVAIWLNTQTALQDAIIGTSTLLDAETAMYTIAAFTASAIAADGGRRAGNHLARDVFSVTAPRAVTEVRQLVRSAGRVVAVELPAKIEDLEGYDPVDETTKSDLAGQTFYLPRRLDADAIRERVRERLERDYGIGHADVRMAEDRTIDSLAVGSRPAGIGPTLAPGSVAVAIRGDPAPDASPGDAVRIWGPAVEAGAGNGGSKNENKNENANSNSNSTVRRLAAAELRGVAEDVVTIAVDTAAASTLTADTQYRIVTRPGASDAERELVSLLRAADDTITAHSVEPGDTLEGESIGSLPVLVVALERADGKEVGLPSDEIRLEAGDTVYVLGRPDALRRLAE